MLTQLLKHAVAGFLTTVLILQQAHAHTGGYDVPALSSISPATIQIRSNPDQDITELSRDTDNAHHALGKIFDQKKVEEQQEFARVFGEEAFRLVGDVSKAMGWKDGSPEKIALHGIVAAIQANFGGGNTAVGGLAGMTNEALIPIIAEQLQKNGIKQGTPEFKSLMQIASTLVGSAVGTLAGGSSNTQTGGAVALSATTNNYLKHYEVEAMAAKLKQCGDDQECKDKVAKEYYEISKKNNEALRGFTDIECINNAIAEIEAANKKISELRYDLGGYVFLVDAWQNSGLGSAQQRVAEIQQAKEAARVLQAFARTSCKDKSPEECLALFEKEREKGRHLLHTLASFFSVYGVPNDLSTLLTGEDLNGEEGSRLWAFIGIVTGRYGSKFKKGKEIAEETLDVLQKGKTVLGKYPDYIELADEIGARRFNIPTEVWNKMSEAEQWAANQKFLDRMIKRGDDIILSNPVKNIEDVSGSFRKELDYLIEKGFRLSEDGTRMIRK